MKAIPWMALTVAWVWMASRAEGQLTNPACVVNGMGRLSSGEGLSHVGAGAQSGGIELSRNGSYIHYAGFLNTFFLKPTLDTDGDGVPDEADSDNDNDRLFDEEELTGARFAPSTPTNPNTADSDGDGSTDYEEMTAGTNPQDEDSVLRFVTIEAVGSGQVRVAWTARGNYERTYVLKVKLGSYAVPDLVVFSNTVSGGTAPWYSTLATNVTAVVTNGQFYSVEVHKP